MLKYLIEKITIFHFLILYAKITLATPVAPKVFCEITPDARICQSPKFDCTFCHSNTPGLNQYGTDLQIHMGGNSIKAGMADAVKMTQNLDSDGDTITNEIELSLGSLPGDSSSVPETGPKGTYSFITAFKRMKITYCGEPANFQEIETLKNTREQNAMLHTVLETCLNSEYWRKEALYRLADKKIRPIYAVGAEGDVVIGDYSWDYQLYAHVMTGDRDARELLTADYHVDSNGNVLQGTVARGDLQFEVSEERIVIAGGQPLQPDRRAGMITTQWFLSVNTMFSELPRTTAAQFSRAYLGLDIAQGEGLRMIPNEPRDVDNKNVRKPECAFCHSALDSLSYPFSTYQGIEVGFGLIFNNIGTYNANRAPWEGDGYYQGRPVSDLLDLVNRAKESEDFKKKLTLDIFKQAIGRGPKSNEFDEFSMLWQSLPEDGFSVNKLIHRLVNTNAFGGAL